MAVLDNIISGYFTSDGTAKLLNIRSDLDQIVVVNQTQMATQQATGRGVRFEWYRGMPQLSQMRYFKTNSTDALNVLYETTGGFSLVNTSQDLPGAAVAVTDISNVSPPVVTAATTGLTNGDVVRIINAVNGANFYPYGGVDFTIGAIIPATSFTLAYMVAAGNADTAQYRRIPYDPIYYPVRRTISQVVQGVTTEIQMTVTHGYTIGQRVTFNVSSDFGMVQLNGLRAQIIGLNTTLSNSILVNIDSSAFTAFSWPAAAAVLNFTPAQVMPFGDAPLTLANPLGNQSVLDGSTRNIAELGILLDAGAQLPGGSNGDVMRWIAYKSSQVQTS